MSWSPWTIAPTNAAPNSFTLLTRYPTPSAITLPALIWPNELLNSLAALSPMVSVPLTSRNWRSSPLILDSPAAKAVLRADPVRPALFFNSSIARRTWTISFSSSCADLTPTVRKALAMDCADFSAAVEVSLLAAVVALSCDSTLDSSDSQNLTYSPACCSFFASSACCVNAFVLASSRSEAASNSTSRLSFWAASAASTMAKASFCHCAAAAMRACSSASRAAL